MAGLPGADSKTISAGQRCAIMPIIAHPLPAEIAPRNPAAGASPVTTTASDTFCRNCSRLRRRKRFAVEITCLVALPQ